LVLNWQGAEELGK